MVRLREQMSDKERRARLTKALFDKGLVTRDDSEKPFVYQLTERGREYIGSSKA